MKKILFVFIILLGSVMASVAYAQETMTLTTFYPSPIGAYDSIRLVPRGPFPGADCDEAAELGFLYYDNTTNVIRVCIDDAGVIGWQTLAASGAASLWTQIGDDLYTSDFANPNLNVGIGIEFPLAKLHISDATNALLRIDPTDTGTADPTIWLRDTFDTAGFKIWYDNSIGSTYFDNLYDNPAGDVHFRTKVAGTPVDVLTLESAGNVGIGTLNPVEKLSVAGSISASEPGKSTVVGSDAIIYTYSTGADTYFMPRTYTSDYAKFGYVTGATYIDSVYQNGPAPIKFKIDGTDRVIIDSSGNVGIGTNTPGARLDILSNSSTWGGWQEAIRLSNPSHSAITLPAGNLLFGLHNNRKFRFADTAGLGKYVMTIDAITGNTSILGALTAGGVSSSGNVSVGGELRTTRRYRTYLDIDGGVDNKLNMGQHDMCWLSAEEYRNSSGKCMVHFDNPNIDWALQSVTKAPGVKPTWYLYAKRYSGAEDVRCKATCMDFGP